MNINSNKRPKTNKYTKEKDTKTNKYTQKNPPILESQCGRQRVQWLNHNGVPTLTPM